MNANRTTDINELIQRLHEKLQGLPNADAETRGLLETLLDDVRRTLSKGEPDARDEQMTTLDRLGALEREFESKYPAIAGLLGRIADGLSSMGI